MRYSSEWEVIFVIELIFNTLASVDFFVVKPACTCLTRTYFIRVSWTYHVHYWVSWKHKTPKTPTEWLWTLLIRVRKLSESGSIYVIIVQSHSVGGLRGLCFQDTHALPAYGLLRTFCYLVSAVLKWDWWAQFQSLLFGLCCFWSRFFSSSIAVTCQSY